LYDKLNVTEADNLSLQSIVAWIGAQRG